MSEEKKNNSMELNDEQLEQAVGGSRPKQRQTKLCARCTNPIPVNNPTDYCNECLEEMRKQGVHPFV